MSLWSVPRPVVTRQALVTYFADEIRPKICYCAASLKGAGDKWWKLKTLFVAGEARATTYTSNHTHKSSCARPKA